MFASSILRRISAVSLATVLRGSVLLLLLSSTYFAQSAFAQVKPIVAYTGKTYGYLRNDRGSPEGDLADDFIRTFCYIKTRYPQAILVGMGDNFAPDYRARYYQDSGQMKPVPRLDGLGPGVSPAVQFFQSFPLNSSFGVDCRPWDRQTATYDAMVPGQLDFYFGADFLWHLGNGTNGDPATAPLSMLAANLVVQTPKPPITPQQTCGQPQLLLPTQVSLPLQSNSGSGGGKGKGGGGKKGGGGGGGGGSGSGQGSSGSAQGGGGQAGQSGQLCVPQRTAEDRQGKVVRLVTPSADAVYPWVSEFEFTVPEGVDPQHPFLCPWDDSRKDDSIGTCKNLNSPTVLTTEKSVTYLAQVMNGDLMISPEGLLRVIKNNEPNPPVLSAGSQIELCLLDADATEKEKEKGSAKLIFKACTATPIRVQTPFFSRAWKTVPKQWGRKNINYAVFAGLDPAMRGLISPENDSWGEDNQYTGQIGIPDPAPALQQLMTAFRRLHPDDQWTYVLLAQMQRSTAQKLVASLRWQEHNLPDPLKNDGRHDYRFQVVLSAADFDEATPESKLTLYADAGFQYPPTPVITPHPIVTKRELRNPLAVVEVEAFHNGEATYENHIFGLTTYDYHPYGLAKDEKRVNQPTADDKPVYRATAECPSLKDSVQPLNAAALHEISVELHVDANGDNTCNGDNSFQCLALKKMRDQLEADAAILQQRDFYTECYYDDPGPSNPPPQSELVQRVLWNSGYLTRASVSGTTLKAILQASDKIKQLEQSSTNQPIEPGHGMVYIGITKSSGVYYLNGAALEDSKIYSIATSDQLALGDPSYSQFSQPDLVLPNVYTEYFKQTFAIADLAALPFLCPEANKRQLRQNDGLTPQLCPGFPAPTHKWLKREDVVAVLPDTLNVPDPTKPPTPKGVPPAPFTPEKNPVVTAFQNRHVLSITLQQASAGYTDSRPNQSDASIGTNLSGVNNPNVLSPHSDSISFSDSLRVLWQYKPYWNFGFDQVLQLNRTRQGSTSVPTGPPPITTTGAAVPLETTSLSANSLIVSPFFELQKRRWQGHWKLAVRPMTFSSGIATFDQFLATGIKSASGQPSVQYELRLKHQENWQPSVGGRYEWDNLNFFEAGWLYQSARNIPSSLIVDGTPHSLTAGVTISQAATSFITTQGQMAVVEYKTYQQQGGYWLGMFTHNFTRNWKTVKITYQGYTFGNFFAYGPSATTSTALTRYAAELSNNLQLQLWGNISFGPAYNIFWFQDQSHKPGNSLTRRDWNLQLNYSFDWHQGLEWKDVLEGKTQ